MKRAVVIVAVVFLVGGLLSGALPARATSPQQEADSPDTALHAYAASPSASPKADDEQFVADTGGDLDLYLFRTDVPDGRLRFEIPITRYYSGKITQDTVDAQGFLKQEILEELVDKHILPNTARLRLQVFDVDEEASDCPEVDHIYVNGKQVLRTGAPVRLSGANNTWSTPSFEVPISMLKFPTAKGSNGGAPTPASNEIAVAINVSNCIFESRSRWAVQVDWGVIEIPSPIRPLLFAHGWTGVPDTFREFENFALADGILSAGKPDLSRGIYPIAQTSPLLVDAINQAVREFGVDKINLFAHSKGGLVARHALRSATVAEKVDHLITFGSPHHGTDMISWFVDSNCSEDAFSDGDERAACEAAALELTEEIVRERFNFEGCSKGRWPWSEWENCRPTYVEQPSVHYRSIVGGIGDVGGKTGTYPWEADAVPFPKSTKVDAQFGNGYYHTNINTAAEPYRCAISFIDDNIYGRSNCPSSAAAGVIVAEVSDVPLWPDETYQVVQAAVGDLMAGEQATISITVDSAGQAVFNVMASEELVAVTLKDRDGNAVMPSTPGATYAVQKNELFGWWYQYRIDTPNPGSWSLDLSTSNATSYSANVMVSSETKLFVRTDKHTYAPNEMVTLEASLAEGTEPLLAATISLTVVRPDDTLLTINLADDGTSGDQTAGDGVYTTQFGSSSLEGRHLLSLSAASGQTRRAIDTYIDVTPQTARIVSISDEVPVDTDGDSLYDELNIRALLNVARAGHFEVICTLVDRNGESVASASYATLRDGAGPLTAGNHVIPLTFSGTTIRNHGMDGPYTLTYVIVEDQTGTPVQVQSAENLYTTAPYRAVEFQGDLISLTQTGETLIDINGNGAADVLRLNLAISVVNPGTYEMNGRLVDPYGNEIAWEAASIDAASSGVYEVQLDFDGQSIGQHCVAGTYTLQDLSVFNTTGPGSAVFNQAHVTQAYNYSVFEGASSCDRPDLIVQNVMVDGNDVQVVIQNQGVASVPAAQGFWVDLYIDPSTPPSQPNQIWNFLGDEGLVWGVDGDMLPLEPGEVITLTLGDALYWPDLSNFSGTLSPGTPIYVQVDSANTDSTYGGVLESHEAIGGPYNNVAGPVSAAAATAHEKVFLPLIDTQKHASAADLAEDTPQHSLPSRVQPEMEN